MLEHKAANIGTVLNSMSKCKATVGILLQSYKQLVAIRELTKPENQQYLAKAFFYGLTANEPHGEGKGFTVRLEGKTKTLAIKLELDPVQFDVLPKVQTWLSNSFR